MAKTGTTSGAHPGLHQPCLLWFTRDLRLRDQPALRLAIASGRKLVACFILDDAEHAAWHIGGATRWWLHHSLAALTADLAPRGLALILRRGDSATQIVALARDMDAAEVFVGQAIEPAARAAQDTAEAMLVADGRALRRVWTRLLFDPTRIATNAGTPYGVFTPFAKACHAQGVADDVLPAPRALPPGKLPASAQLDDWQLRPTKPDWAGGLRDAWQPGEAGARQALARFIAGPVASYHATRDFPGQAGVSRLSPHLHFGEISPREAWIAATRAPAAADHSGKGPATFLNELLWREFSAHLLWHHPTLPDRPLRPEFARMPWRQDAPALQAWQRGQTGIPIVDAGMRQLWQTGWMHNRIRMVVASFLIKHLLIDWRAGEAWFWDTLVDADLASNSANWQWVAGCGADAAPFFRVFNPWLQGQKFDADGAYVRQFVPELAKLPDKYLHAPAEAPESILRAAGVNLGQTYPRAIVDLAAGRARALAAFRDVNDKVPA